MCQPVWSVMRAITHRAAGRLAALRVRLVSSPLRGLRHASTARRVPSRTRISPTVNFARLVITRLRLEHMNVRSVVQGTTLWRVPLHVWLARQGVPIRWLLEQAASAAHVTPMLFQDQRNVNSALITLRQVLLPHQG